jgi:hypothetical protein
MILFLQLSSFVHQLYVPLSEHLHPCPLFITSNLECYLFLIPHKYEKLYKIKGRSNFRVFSYFLIHIT